MGPKVAYRECRDVLPVSLVSCGAQFLSASHSCSALDAGFVHVFTRWLHASAFQYDWPLLLRTPSGGQTGCEGIPLALLAFWLRGSAVPFRVLSGVPGRWCFWSGVRRTLGVCDVLATRPDLPMGDPANRGLASRNPACVRLALCWREPLHGFSYSSLCAPRRARICIRFHQVVGVAKRGCQESF